MSVHVFEGSVTLFKDAFILAVKGTLGQEAVRRGRKDDSWQGCIFEKLTVIT